MNKEQDILKMKQVAGGDKEAFRQLALIYQSPLVSFCIKMLNGHEAFAEDVMQQTLMTWWQKAPLWSHKKGSLQAWVFTIAANKCKDYLKRSHVHKAIEESDIICENDALLELNQQTQRFHIHTSMEPLNAQQKQIICLHYFAQMSQKSIAESLYISVKNVEVQLYRAKKKMKIHLQNEKENLL